MGYAGELTPSLIIIYYYVLGRLYYLIKYIYSYIYLTQKPTNTFFKITTALGFVKNQNDIVKNI